MTMIEIVTAAIASALSDELAGVSYHSDSRYVEFSEVTIDCERLARAAIAAINPSDEMAS